MADDNLKNKENEKGMGAGAGATTGGQYQQGEQAGRNPQDKGQDAGGVGGSQRNPEESRGTQGGHQNQGD
ncbi:MAG: hypothetical protein JWM21_792 [Acidobacteria bacterium]|nr:hypothetical protein [Acidobacteriota bacterium]